MNKAEKDNKIRNMFNIWSVSIAYPAAKTLFSTYIVFLFNYIRNLIEIITFFVKCCKSKDCIALSISQTLRFKSWSLASERHRVNPCFRAGRDLLRGASRQTDRNHKHQVLSV